MDTDFQFLLLAAPTCLGEAMRRWKPDEGGSAFRISAFSSPVHGKNRRRAMISRCEQRFAGAVHGAGGTLTPSVVWMTRFIVPSGL
jgi:hypothetical protein